MMKDDLYGRLDATTREWTDGIFTDILRKIIANNASAAAAPSAHDHEEHIMQEHCKPTTFPRRHWIIFDGDVDPNWAENLNSVLDDNKMLTLPSGERLLLPSNVRILFEVGTQQAPTIKLLFRLTP